MSPQELREKVAAKLLEIHAGDKYRWVNSWGELSEPGRNAWLARADRILALLPSPQGSRSEAEGSNPPSSPQVLEGDETLREALDRLEKGVGILKAAAEGNPGWGYIPEDVDAVIAMPDMDELRALLPQPRPQAPAVDAQLLIDNAKFWISKGDVEGASQWRFGLVRLMARAVDSLKGSPAIQVQEGAGSPKGSPGDVGVTRFHGGTLVVNGGTSNVEAPAKEISRDGAGPGRPDPDAKTRLEEPQTQVGALWKLLARYSNDHDRREADGCDCSICLDYSSLDWNEMPDDATPTEVAPKAARSDAPEASSPEGSPSPSSSPPLVLVEAARELSAAVDEYNYADGSITFERCYNAREKLEEALSSLPVPSQASTGRECWVWWDEKHGALVVRATRPDWYPKSPGEWRRMVDAAAPGDRIGDRKDLVQERDELRGEVAALEAKVETLETELAAAKHLLEQAEQARPLPLEALILDLDRCLDGSMATPIHQGSEYHRRIKAAADSLRALVEDPKGEKHPACCDHDYAPGFCPVVTCRNYFGAPKGEKGGNRG